MQLDDFKKNMSALEQVLAKTSTDIKIDVTASETARTKILNEYRKAFTSNGIIAIVFSLLWIGGVDSSLPTYIRAFVVIYTAIGCAWYVFMYHRLKRVDISRLSPKRLFSTMTSIRLMALSGEIVLALGAAVFLTLLIQCFLVSNTLAFWMTVIVLTVGFVWSFRRLPQYIQLFRDLTSIEE